MFLAYMGPVRRLLGSTTRTFPLHPPPLHTATHADVPSTSAIFLTPQSLPMLLALVLCIS
jgi:hypothetical protein